MRGSELIFFPLLELLLCDDFGVFCPDAKDVRLLSVFDIFDQMRIEKWWESI